MAETFIFLVLLILVPLAMLAWVARRTYASRLEAVLGALFTALFVLFLFLWGQYPYVGSYYFRYVLVVLAGMALFLVFRSVRERPWFSGDLGWRRWLAVGLSVVGSLLLLPLNWGALQAHRVDGPTVDMEFPFRAGTFYISTGGSNAVLNLHHKPNTPAQMYAIDIDRLDGLGRYARGLIPDQLDDHLMFGELVQSPSDGLVIEARGDVADHAPYDYDPDTGAGNHVVIETDDGLQVALFHLRQGSVLVVPGDRVAAGDPIGRVGNSGFSVQPHLHLQVSRPATADPEAGQVGVPVRFGGRFLVRNDVMRR
ncbi:MAG: M23 family metallopeptidase [Gemmatimonadales bacterium]